jgi:hypothetical protein
MKKSKNENKSSEERQIRKDAKIGDKIPGRNISEQSDIEQTRIENRREAALEDKTPAGDAGVEDNKNERQADDPIGESNY